MAKTIATTSGFWKVQIEGLDETTALVAALPGMASRARASAMKSVGWWVRKELKDWVQTAGEGSWEKLHPFTVMRKPTHRTVKVYKGRKRWTGGYRKVRIPQHKRSRPLFQLGQFARYRVDKDGTIVDIDFGKSRKGQPGTFDPEISSWVKRAERGDKTTVTAKTRRFWAAASRSGIKGFTPRPGKEYFPLKDETTTLETPKRPIFKPVKSRVLPGVPKRFKEKFWLAMARYRLVDPGPAGQPKLKPY